MQGWLHRGFVPPPSRGFGRHAHGVCILDRVVSLYRVSLLYRSVSQCIDTERCIGDSEARPHVRPTIQCIGPMYLDVSGADTSDTSRYIKKCDTSKAIHLAAIQLRYSAPIHRYTDTARHSHVDPSPMGTTALTCVREHHNV